MTEEKRHITRADLIGLLVTAIFAFVEGAGQYTTGQSIITSILIGLGFFVVFGFICWFIKFAKTTCKNPNLWRAMEYVGICAYIVVALFCFGKGNVIYSSVFSNSISLSNSASSDLEKIQTMYSQYDEQRKDALRNATEMLNLFVKIDEKDQKRYTLYKYIELSKFQIDITNEWDDITRIDSKQNDSIVMMKENVKQLVKLPRPSDIHNLKLYLTVNMDSVNGANKKLEEKIAKYTREQFIIPEIKFNYGWNKENGFFKFQFNLPQSEFVKQIEEYESNSENWITKLKSKWYWIYHCVFIFWYLVTQRNNFVGLDRKVKIGGLPLITNDNENNETNE